MARVADEMRLHWTMPRRNTDHFLLKGQYTAHLCWEDTKKSCRSLTDQTLAPAVSGEYRYHLPPELANGPAHPVTYRVEIKNRAGHSYGLSNPAITLLGSAPAPVTDFHAEMKPTGVVLAWKPEKATTVRLHRVLQASPNQVGKKEANPRGAEPEPSTQNLLVQPKDSSDPGQAIDVSVALNRHYSYSAERVVAIDVEGSKVEISSAASPMAMVDTKDVFPPAVPSELVTIALEAPESIDLSWSANTEEDLAGYFVYRRQEGEKAVRISPVKPILGPSFRDASGKAGVHYFYSVTSVDRNGNESAPSQESEETYP